MNTPWENKYKEACWKRACSLSHSTWCQCGKWWSHTTGDVENTLLAGGIHTLTIGDGDGTPGDEHLGKDYENTPGGGKLRY